MSKKHHIETKAIRTQIDRTPAREHSAPLYLTSSFTFDDAEMMRAAFADEIDANIYSRFVNPNSNEFIDKLCAMEGAEAGFATASGMSAIFSTFVALCSQGDHIVCCRSVFGSTHTVLEKILPRFGISHSYVDVKDTENWGSTITKNTRLVYVETPTNPGLEILDLPWVSAFCKEHNVLLVVDNCFATPYLQQPVRWGAHLVIHSATKFMDGQGRVLGGAVVGPKEFIEQVYAFCRSTGPSLSPFNAWVLSKSLETLHVRMDRHSSNALKLAEYLQEREDVLELRYPFLPSHPQYEVAKKQMKAGGGLVAFQLAGLENGRRFLDAVEMCSLTANLGDTRTIVSHPSSTTHAKLTEEDRLASGITPGLIRISVGLEHIDDIIADIDQALDKAY